MKNIQVVEPALNCCYQVFQVSDRSFKLLFPQKGQDVEFVEDVTRRLERKVATKLFARVLAPRSVVEKKSVHGIHGTLYINMVDRKKFYPTKRESDLDLVPSGRPRQPSR